MTFKKKILAVTLSLYAYWPESHQLLDLGGWVEESWKRSKKERNLSISEMRCMTFKLELSFHSYPCAGLQRSTGPGAVGCAVSSALKCSRGIDCVGTSQTCARAAVLYVSSLFFSWSPTFSPLERLSSLYWIFEEGIQSCCKISVFRSWIIREAHDQSPSVFPWVHLPVCTGPKKHTSRST